MSLVRTGVNPLELPEIRDIIGRYLDRPDLTQCLRVCRSWHDSFSPFVWCTVSAKPGQPCPTVDAFRHHNELIKNLTCHSDMWQEYTDVFCPNLSSLDISIRPDQPPIPIAQYEHLRYLRISGQRFRSSFYPVWKTTHRLNNLSRLELRVVDIEPKDAASFWDLCTQLEILLVYSTHIPDLPDKSMKFERLQELGVSLRSNQPLERQLDWFEQCPNLFILDWNAWSEPESTLIEDFAARLAAGTWPKLYDLNIADFHALDDQLAKIIEGMPQVKEFGAIECQFGPLSFPALRPHFSILRRLDIAFSDIPTGPMIPEILASCPQLEYLCADDVMSEDIIDSGPWVCGETLKALHVRFCITARHHQQDVFGRISQLPHLEHLVFFGFYREPGSKGMEFRLGAGLELLTTLKQLKELSLFDAGDYLRASDIEWMLDNWKNLQLFHGVLNADFQDELVAMLKNANIQYI